MSFALNLRNYRAAAGYSAKEFSQKLGVPYPTYTAWENEKSAREPKYSMLCDIARALYITPNDLLGFSPITDDPILEKVQAASIAAAAAAAASFGISPAKTPDEADLIFYKLRALLDRYYLSIQKDPDTSPDPKFGDSILIRFDSPILKLKEGHVTKDYLYRAYLLASRIRIGIDRRADEDFSSYIIPCFFPNIPTTDDNRFIAQKYKDMFDSEIASLSADKIKDIVYGRTDDPSLHRLTDSRKTGYIIR